MEKAIRNIKMEGMWKEMEKGREAYSWRGRKSKWRIQPRDFDSGRREQQREKKRTCSPYFEMDKKHSENTTVDRNRNACICGVWMHGRETHT